MHGFTRGLERRLRALEQRLGAATAPETDDDQAARRLELIRAALEAREPASLTATERVTFSKITATLPVFLELRDEGIIDGHGQPAGGDDYPYDGHEDPYEEGDAPPYEDPYEDGDGRPVWRS